jgi:hypothetical protein
VCAPRPLQLEKRRGLFGELFGLLDSKGPAAFQLPKDIRDYFEGVATGERGDYQAAAESKR